MPPRRAGGFIAGDPLRAIAALSVLVYHTAFFVATAGHSRWFYGAFGPVTGHGLASLDLGLFVFFVLSGYLISGPFVRAFVAGEPLPRMAPYLRNRLLRIVPAFWMVLTILILCVGTYGASLTDIAWVYGFAQNYGNTKISHVIGQAWTLDVEFAFYAFLPVVTIALVRACAPLGERARRQVLFAALATGAGASLTLRTLGPSTVTPHAFAWQTSLPAMVFAFIPGVTLAAIETTGIPSLLRARDSKLPAVVLLVAGLLVFALYGANSTATSPQFMSASGAFLAALGTGAVVGAALVLQWSTGRCWRGLDNRLMHWIGKRSYSLYLVHQVIAAVVVLGWSAAAGNAPGARLALALPFVLVFSLAAAALSYRLFERPFLRVRARSRAGRLSLAPAPLSPP